MSLFSPPPNPPLPLFILYKSKFAGLHWLHSRCTYICIYFFLKAAYYTSAYPICVCTYVRQCTYFDMYICIYMRKFIVFSFHDAWICICLDIHVCNLLSYYNYLRYENMIARISACINIWIYIYISVFTHTHMYLICIYIYIYIFTVLHTYNIHTCRHTYIHTYIHTSIHM